MKTCCFGYASESPAIGSAIVRNKTSSCRKTSLRLVTVGLALGLLSTLHAANVVWIGGSTGTWEDAVNWSTDPALPGTADNAQLLDVTSGTREVTISSDQTINQLTITQTTVGAFNVLNVNANLTINGNANPFVMDASAGQDSIITNIADGKTLLAIRNNGFTSVFDGTLNLGAASVFQLENSNVNADMVPPVFNGLINANGAGAKIVIKPGRFLQPSTTPVAFNGAINVTGVGNSLAIQRLNASDAASPADFNFNGDDGSGNSVNLGTGTQLDLDVQGGGSSTAGGQMTFAHRVTLAGASGSDAGAILNIGPNADRTTGGDFNGGLVMGAGAKTIATGSRIGPQITLAGVSTFDAGSELRLKYTGNTSAPTFTNTGTLTMDGAAVNFDFAAADNNSGTRSFQNAGSWTLKNGSTVAFISSTGRATTSFGIGTKNNNSGTFNVESGSKVGFQDLFNTGTMNLGSSTAGVSDALVTIGSPDNTFDSVTLTNGVTSDGTGTAGTINVNGDTWLGRTITSSKSTTLNNGAAASAGSVINIGDGAVAATLTLGNSNVYVNNAAGNTINVNAGGTLSLKSVYDIPNADGEAKIVNSGTFNHAGTLQFQTNRWGYPHFEHDANSTYRISGTAAKIEVLPGNGSGTTIRGLTSAHFISAGLVTGATSHDTLSYVNSTGSSSFDKITLTITNGALTPGNGSNGSGVSSIGELEFSNINLTLASTTATFDIGGSSLFDSLVLSGTGAVLDLGTGSILDINLVNGFTSVAGTYRIITADSLTGEFDTLLLNGGANNGGYTVNYLSNGVEVSVIPEPATVGLLMGGLVLFVMAGRRRRTAA